MNAATNIKVTKRDGRLEDINLDKIHRVVTWAAEGLQNVSVSQVELKSHIQFYNGIRTDDIHETIIKAAADLISQDTPDYQYLAARLAIFHLRKIAYGEFEPPHLYDHVKKLTEAGKYDRHIIADYSREEFDELNAYIDHSRDMTFSYAAVKQLEGWFKTALPAKFMKRRSFYTFWWRCVSSANTRKRRAWITSNVFTTPFLRLKYHCQPRL